MSLNAFRLPVLGEAGLVDWQRHLQNAQNAQRSQQQPVGEVSAFTVGQVNKGRRNSNDVRKLRDRLKHFIAGYKACHHFMHMMHIGCNCQCCQGGVSDESRIYILKSNRFIHLVACDVARIFLHPGCQRNA